MDLAKVNQAVNSLDVVLSAWRGMKDLAEAAQVVVKAYNEVHLVQQAKEKAEAEYSRLLEDIKKASEQKESLDRQARLQADKYKEMLDKSLAETQEQVAALRMSVDSVRMEADKKVKEAETEASKRISEVRARADEEVKAAREHVQAAQVEVALWENKLTGAMKSYEDFRYSVLGVK